MESSEGQKVRSNRKQKPNSTGSRTSVQCSVKGPSKGCSSDWRQMEAKAVQHYQVGNYSLAAECYSECLQQTGIPTPSRLSLLHSRSAANLKLKKYSLVLEDCNKILKLEAGNLKALARKIKALSGERKFSEAQDVALQWRSLDPNNDQLKKELERLNIIITALQEQDAEEDEIDDGIVITTERCEPPEGEESENEGSSYVTPGVSRSSGAVGLPPDDSNTAPGEKENPTMEDDDDLYHCKYCDINFTSNTDFRLHCQSDQHQRTVSSDEGGTWTYRPPPRGLTSDEYSQCPRFCGESSCRFGDQCTQAHSEDELEEWRRRFEYRRQRLMKAKDSEMMQGSSFAEQLLERWMSAQNPELILTDEAEGINIVVNSDLSVTMTSKTSASSWIFTVTSKVCMKSVVLLDDTNRRYFNIHSVTVGPKRSQKAQNLEESCQEWTNPSFISTRCTNEKVYRIKIVFKTDIYGTFRQSIVFNFGTEPMLVREFCVGSSPVVDIERLQQDLILNEEGRWDLTTKNIVEFVPRPRTLDASDQALLQKYPPPMATKFTLSEVLLSPELKKETYKQRMHELLCIEEMAQFSSISKFNIRTSLHLVNRFLLMPSAVSTAKFAQGGELFARMKLNSDLSEDTSQGRLVLQNVSTVYLAPRGGDAEGNDAAGPKMIYEALVEEKGKNFIFLRLSANCVKELNLVADTELSVEVQFQLNRLPICEMHEALDQLPNLDVVFPSMESAAGPIPWNPLKQWNGNLDTRLNLKQKEAIVAITTDIKRHLPPTLIVGPYGTGKTFTLAHAARCLLEDESTRVLICTHSNSAADLYVKEYLDPFVKEGHPEAKPLRVYYRHRWVQTVNPTVLEYCLVSYEGAVGSMFRKPTKEDIENHRVIVCTLSTSRYLFSLGLEEGFFTHILLDEAAQAQECETVMPLVLAGPQTRVVLAGDHMQLGPEIHSDFARERNMHISFLERLYDYYPTNHSCKILLCENYRSHVAIINYTSELFYNKKLVASGKQPRHDIFYPLTFFTARGEDMQHQNSTAFYNNSEVYEIVERVMELQKTWPTSWGALDESSIGVVSPYYDQVIRIRAELRKKKLFSVSVERVLNVQGKQFRAIFLSTVRTRNTCSSDISMEEFMDYGFLSNVKLLNTAITRAQSLVAVVGDPVSLCSVGKCRKLWERFIQICNENTSLYGITWTQLRAQLDGVELKKTYVLNPNAPEFIPRRLRHGPFAPLEPVAMGRYGYTFVSQPPQGIITTPPPWLPKNPFTPQFKHPDVYYRSGRPQMYPVPGGYTAYMTPMVKVTGSPVHLPGGVPTSLSMPPPTLTIAALKGGASGIQNMISVPPPTLTMALKGGAPGIQSMTSVPPPTLAIAALKGGAPGVQNMTSVKDIGGKKTSDRLASQTSASESGSLSGALLPSPKIPLTSAPQVTAPSSPLNATQYRYPPFGVPQLPIGVPYVPHYRLAYMPAYAGVPPPLSPHIPVSPSYGVIYPPNFGMKPPAIPPPQGYPLSPPMKTNGIQAKGGSTTLGLEGAASGSLPSPYQFLPNTCNTQTEPSSAGAASAENQAAAKLPSAVRKMLGTDNRALLNNHFFQKELYSYIHQVEGEEGIIAFMNYIQEQQMKSNKPGHQDDSASQPLSPKSQSSYVSKMRPKKEVVSVGRTPESRKKHRYPDSTAQNGYETDESSDSQIGSWHNFDASSPPFSKLAGNFRKAVNAGRYDLDDQETEQSRPSYYDRHKVLAKDTPHSSSASGDSHVKDETLSDLTHPFAVSDMMKFLEEIAEDDVRETEQPKSDKQGPVNHGQDSNAIQSMRPVPLYMRVGVGASGGVVPPSTDSQSPPAQTTMSYAGALRSQLSPPAQPKSTLTPEQEASRQHLMSLLKCRMSDNPTAAGATYCSSHDSNVRNYPISTNWQMPAGQPAVLPHSENSVSDLAGSHNRHSSRDVPVNPLDVLKNLHIKASPGTQALYQYFS